MKWTIVAFVVALFVGCGSQPTPHTGSRQTPATATPTRKPSRGTALAALATLAVKGRAPMTGYAREQFGDGWVSIDGCDTRQRILVRDLRHETFEPGSSCDVRSGALADPYTASAIEFVRGGASEVDIDHVVALGDAWQKGAQQWTYERRVALANDPLNLLAADASANRQKGDGDAATWLPANKSFRCAYVARQVAVKHRYRIWVTAAEHDAIQRVLTRCPATPLPAGGRVRIPARPPSSGGLTYDNCDAVRAAGRAPLRRGDPAYAANPQLDRDKNGVACQ